MSRLRHPWPVADDGAALTVWTALDERTVHLGFARSGRPELRLPDFTLPTPSAVRTAG